jgi:processive 1,2-diacylglycerol beta-glucosyltransferase
MMRPPRVLLLYSPAGCGHRSAAGAIAEALGRARPDARVEVCDVLRFAPDAFRYDRWWQLIQRHGASGWDRLFDWTDRPHPRLAWARERLNLALLGALEREVDRLAPDRIVCTHFLPAVGLALLARRGRLRATLSTVVTDYLAHRAWVAPGVARYYAATRVVALELAARGAPAGSIAVTGIPLRAAMDAPPAPLDGEGAPRVLFLAGGVARPRVREALASLRGRSIARLDLVAGDDPELRRLLAQWTDELALPAAVHGFVPSLAPLLDRAHLAVTKAGGLVVSECLARGRAMVLPWPAPGQERGNRDHALAVGAAAALDAASETGAAIERLVGETGQLQAMARAALRAASPGAADRIADDLLAGLAASDEIGARRAAGGAR